jgi:peptide/nickel transport system permease protein
MSVAQAVLTLPRTGLSRLVSARVSVSAGAAGIVLLTLLFLAVFAGLIRPLDTRNIHLDAILQAPSWDHPMGTDEVGRDLLARVLHGLRVSFTIAATSSLIALLIGGLIGLTAGAFAGRVDSFLMRFLDVFASQNHLLFGIILAVLFRPTFGPVGATLLAVGVTHWVTMARIIRGELLSLRERPFIEAAVNGGAGRLRLIYRHFLPHLLPAVGLGFVLLFPHAIFHESALSFLGVGLPPHQASLGNVLADGRRSLLAGGWWPSLFAGLMIFLVSAAIGTLGEYWRDKTHPRWRSELEL